MQPLGVMPGPIFTADGIADAAEVLDVGALDLRGAHADPRADASTGCTSRCAAAP
jgi:hypothetical protein